MKGQKNKKRQYRAAASKAPHVPVRPTGGEVYSPCGGYWRRSHLGYAERFVLDFEYGGIRVRQFASRATFDKAMEREKIGADLLRLGVTGANNDTDDYHRDRVPDTAFTVWDASILLGMYASREEVWTRLVSSAAAASSAPDPVHQSPIITLELGAGAGVASLLVAKSNAAIGGRRCIMTLADLPGTISYTKLNALANLGVISENVSIATAPIRWGSEDDILSLPIDLRRPHIVFGADLLYTCDETVIEALAQTVAMLVQPGCVAVFAACKEHRPESIERFIRLLMEEERFEINRILASSAHQELDVSDDDFEIIECWRRH